MQVHALLDTIVQRKSAKRFGHFQLHSGLSIGHKELEGFQRVLCYPFTLKPYRGGNRQDLVFARPPGARDFRLSLESVWFFRVLLLFSFETETDTEIKRHECAFVSLLWEYDEGRPGEKYLLSLLNTSKFIYICVLYLNTTNFI
jgi:hypothetical protein